MNDLMKNLSVLLADTYVLFLKTQNYHWHVTGPNFKTLHELLESQYKDLGDAIDEIAELIRAKGHRTPATFTEFLTLKKLSEGDSNQSAAKMITELADDHHVLLDDLNKTFVTAQNQHDEGISNVISERISAHEKMRWMLKSSI